MVEFTGGDVTILILIDGFLQLPGPLRNRGQTRRHNPYFNRWFSAIRRLNMGSICQLQVTILILIDGFLQCYYRLFRLSR